MDGLDHLLDMVMAPSGGSELLFGSISPTGQVYLDTSDTQLDGAPPSLVRLERGRRFAATLQGKTLLIVGLLDGSDSTPVATILPYGSGEIPRGYLLCNGQAVSRVTYADLFSKIGITYGAGDGSTTFSVPNLCGRVVAGYSAAEPEFNTLGKTGGAKSHTLTAAEMPTHNHSASTSGTYSGGSLQGSEQLQHGGLAAGSLYFVGGTGNKSGTASFSTSVGNAGSGGAHNNLSPYFTTNFIIRT